MLICLLLLNYLVFQYFDFERTWLFLKCFIRTKVDIYVFLLLKGKGDWGLWHLMPFSTIFQLYHGGLLLKQCFLHYIKYIDNIHVQIRPN